VADAPARWGGRQEYTDVLLLSALRAVQDLCERRGGGLESLTCEAIPHTAGDVVVAATPVLLFRGRRCVFRRGIWPPTHPAVYASVLEERLMTRVRPQLSDDALPIDL
jgi:hypothetical protein